MTREIIATDAAPHPDAPISQEVMANLDAILSASGGSLARVVKCTVILARREDWRAMNEIYRTYWPGKDFPARTAFEARLPHPDFLLEVECVAEA